MYLRNLGALDLYAEYYATDYGELAERINQLLDSGADGWRKEGGSWYYYKNGAALKAQWLKDGGHWYWLGEDGAMATGWLSWQGKLYWFNLEQREGVPERGPAHHRQQRCGRMRRKKKPELAFCWIHTVCIGETLQSVAKRFLGSRKRCAEIKRLNGLKSDRIWTGQVLRLPG